MAGRMYSTEFYMEIVQSVFGVIKRGGAVAPAKKKMFDKTDWAGRDISDFIDIFNYFIEWYNEVEREQLTIIPLPPVEEQHRIVKRLDALLPLCEEMRQ